MASYLAESLGEDEIWYYHAGLPADVKRQIEDRFFRSTSAILCATCAYGMGVDKKDVRSVVHYLAPNDVESYLQESGRAGRDGLAAEAVLVTELGARQSPDSFAHRYCHAPGCRRETLMELMGHATEGCSGCDRCGNIASHRRPGGSGSKPFARGVSGHAGSALPQLDWQCKVGLGFLMASSWYWKLDEAAQVLAGFNGEHSHLRQFVQASGSDTLDEADWTIALRGMIQAQLLRQRRSGVLHLTAHGRASYKGV